MVLEQEYLSPEQSRICAILSTISGSVSIASCLVLIILYTWFKEYKTFHLRLIYVQTWLDLLLSVCYVLGANTREKLISENSGGLLCGLEAGFLQLTGVASILWTGALAHTFLRVLGYKDDLVRRFEAPYHLIVWGCSLTNVLVLTLGNGFGDAGLWCWISGDRSAIWYRFGLYYFPTLLVLIWNVCCYALAARRLHMESATSVAAHMSGFLTPSRQVQSIRIITSFGIFVFVFFLVWIISFSNRVAHAIHPDRVIFWLYVCEAITEPSLGFLNVLAYGITEEVFQKAGREIFRSCCPRSRAPPRSSQNIQVSLSSPSESPATSPESSHTRLIKPIKRKKKDAWIESFIAEYDRPPSPPTSRLGASPPSHSLETTPLILDDHLRPMYFSHDRSNDYSSQQE